MHTWINPMQEKYLNFDVSIKQKAQQKQISKYMLKLISDHSNHSQCLSFPDNNFKRQTESD